MSAGAGAGSDVAAASMRELSGRVRRAFPQHIASQHIADAAGALDRGLHDGAIRHLSAAAGSLDPAHLRRLGIADDGRPGAPPHQRAHAVARRLAEEANRHALLVRGLKQGTGTGSPGLRLAGAGAAVELAARVRDQAGL